MAYTRDMNMITQQLILYLPMVALLDKIHFDYLFHECNINLASFPGFPLFVVECVCGKPGYEANIKSHGPILLHCLYKLSTF